MATLWLKTHLRLKEPLMIMNEINEQLLKLAQFYTEANEVLKGHLVPDSAKPSIDALISKQELLSEKLVKATKEPDFVFNASFYAEDIETLYSKTLDLLKNTKYCNELILDLTSFANIHLAQSDQLVTIHELMSSSDGYNN